MGLGEGGEGVYGRGGGCEGVFEGGESGGLRGLGVEESEEG